MNRLEYVGTSTQIFLMVAMNDLTITEVDAYARGIEEVVHEKSREMTAYIGSDEGWLTTHAAHMRTVSAKIVLLRDGLVPAWKIDPQNTALRAQAVTAMGWIRAECEAMTGLMR